jgi:hypothetical protein
MNAQQLQLLRETVVKKFAAYLKADAALSKEGPFIDKSYLDKLAKAKLDWHNADFKWQKALLEYAEELRMKKLKK